MQHVLVECVVHRLLEFVLRIGNWNRKHRPVLGSLSVGCDWHGYAFRPQTEVGLVFYRLLHRKHICLNCLKQSIWLLLSLVQAG